MMYTYILWLAGIAMLLVILARGYSNGMLGSYLLFYTYIGFVLTSTLACIATSVLFGLPSKQYYYAYHLPNLLFPFFQLLLLWSCYKQIIGKAKTALGQPRTMFIFATAMSLPVAAEVFALNSGGFFYHFHTFALTFEVVACMLVCGVVFGQQEVVIGKNLKGILLGLGLMVALQAINFAQFLYRNVSFYEFGFFLQFFYFTALLVFSWGLWDYDPVRQLTSYESEQVFRVNHGFRRVLRAFLFSE